MNTRPVRRHCDSCFIRTDHMRYEERKGPRSIEVTVTCYECGYTRSWLTGADYDPRFDEDFDALTGGGGDDA